MTASTVSTGSDVVGSPLRLWPGVLLAALLVAVKTILPVIVPETTPIAILGGAVLGLAIGIWWMFFSRAPWIERFGGILLIVASLLLTSRFLDVSIATAMMGYMFTVYAIPIAAVALVAWAVVTKGWSGRARRVSLVAVIVITSAGWTLVRTGGFSGEMDHDLAWRWTKTPEQRLLAQASDEPAPPPAVAPAAVVAPPVATAATASAPAAETAAITPAPVAASLIPAPLWPGFRGPARDGVVRGVTIETDWSASPPAEMWRRPIGPGWSSFAVAGALIYTQEQRGDDEVVSAYNLATGKPVWRHQDRVRFWEANGGPGPRATPTLANGRVYTLGATGLLNALDAATGAKIWAQNAAADTGAKLPDWGFSGSPLVLDDLVVVATSGVLAAYDAATGTRRWIGPDAGPGYTSPQLATIGGVQQILLMSGSGLASVNPADGKLLWQHDWPGYPIVQPSVVADDGVLIAANESSGTRRLAVTRGPGGWVAQERWTSNGLKPWFNDFVVHKGHAYGFDGTILACIDLADGTRKWKGGRYGGGQLVLLPDQDAMLVISEQGGLALVSATADGFREIARAAAIEGKTWNHPVVAGNVLLVRNGEEMAAFRLARR
jgi:outer membrane protein assembly factor BamB